MGFPIFLLLLPLVGLPGLSPELRPAAILTWALPSSMVAALGEQCAEGEFGAASMMFSTVV